MKPVVGHAVWLAPLALVLSGCEVVEGIFKLGVWAGVLAVVFVLAVAFGLARLVRG